MAKLVDVYQRSRRRDNVTTVTITEGICEEAWGEIATTFNESAVDEKKVVVAKIATVVAITEGDRYAYAREILDIVEIA